jgi:hypothetical protein
MKEVQVAEQDQLNLMLGKELGAIQDSKIGNIN